MTYLSISKNGVFQVQLDLKPSNPNNSQPQLYLLKLRTYSGRS